MCGIIAVLRRKSGRAFPERSDLLAHLAACDALLQPNSDAAALHKSADRLIDLDRSLRGTSGLWALLQDATLGRDIGTRAHSLQKIVGEAEATLDAGKHDVAGDELERRNEALVRLKDALWAITRDRLPHAESVRALAAEGPLPSEAPAAAFSSLQLALSALDRLEVRGRDSAGISVIVSGVDVDGDAELKRLLDTRTRDEDPLFQNGAVRFSDGNLNFVYKHSAEIGELGDNVHALRATMRNDALLQAALRRETAEALVLGHTRWASVGIISEANAHPLNHEESDNASDAPYVIGALNGDVDNHEALAEQHKLQLHEAITTDAKVIPTLVSHKMRDGHDLVDGFRRVVSSFEGSVAIGAATTREPNKLALALRGSGQALYIGLSEDTFVVASEPYGVIEECEHYLRMDGETPGNPQNPAASRGQVVVLDRAHAGNIEGVERLAYDATPLPVDSKHLTTAAVTTRDIDRGDAPHYLLKEIGESPRSFRKTLRGRIAKHAAGGSEQLRTTLPESSLPASAIAALKDGTTRRILVIGQGTAAVAGQAVAGAIADALVKSPIAVQATPATELSGFAMREDMRDTLIVAISQSGTTTDTNRTVDLVRDRGATVLAIVNRRGSDLTDKANGVIYTSDGRDVEMSVASTKAFYAQCAAGQLLALALARAAGVADDSSEHELLEALQALPDKMRKVLEEDDRITEIARAFAPQRRYWALVGNGKNRVAAAEVRIKLSELCYKSIACDATEDKKHIDLSSEPMILVCAAGLVGGTADDVGKEVAIYKAHKASPIVIATEGESRFDGADGVIPVPQCHPALAYILSTMAGHLFGYRAALAIDESAHSLRLMRGAIESAFADGVEHTGHEGDDALAALAPELLPHWSQFQKDLLAGRFDGSLEARTATRLSLLCTYALGLTTLDSFMVHFGEPGAPGAVIDQLTQELTRAIDELTRPVDAIKHQAKTVTVGISRSDEALLTAPLVRAAMEAGAERDHLVYRDLRALASLDPAVVEVLGSTRYAVAGDVEGRTATARVLAKTGIAKDLPSRTDEQPVLRGTKHQVANERRLLVAKGRSDDRTFVIVPEVHDNQAVGLTLLHVRFHDRLDAPALRSVLGGYRNRYQTLADAVTETEPQFDEDLMATMPVVDLLCESIPALADRWRQGTLQGK
ncbi:MAG: SIS domain-containing protein [Planctomycetota bacterium]